MKKKIALLLAAAISASSMPTSLFAGTINRLNSLYVSNSGVTLMEYGWMTQPGSASAPSTALDRTLPSRSFFTLANSGLTLPDSSIQNPSGIYQLELPYNGSVYANGTDLVLTADSTTGFVQGAQFTVTLANAEWNFADIKDSSSNVVSSTYDKKKGTWDSAANGGGMFMGTYLRGMKANGKRLAPYDLILDNGIANPSVITPGFGKPYPTDIAGTGISPRAVLGTNASVSQKIIEAMSSLKDEVRYLDVTTSEYRPESTIGTYKKAIENISTKFLAAASEASPANNTALVASLNAIHTEATGANWAGITTPSSIATLSVPNASQRSASTRAASMTEAELADAFVAMLPQAEFTGLQTEVAKATPDWSVIMTHINNITALDTAIGELTAEEDFRRNGAYLARNSVGNTAVVEVPYRMEVSNIDKKTATVTITGISNPSSGNLTCELRIPMVVKVTDTAKDVTATVVSYISNVTSGTYFITNVAGTATSTSATTTKTADEFRIDRITIDELRIGSIKNSGWFTISAPEGYRFVNNFNDVAGNVETTENNTAYTKDQPVVRISVGGGLSWDTRTGTPSATVPNNNASLRGASIFGYNPITPVTGTPTYTVIGTTTIPLDTKIAWYGIISTNDRFTSAYGTNNYWYNSYYNTPWSSVPPMYYQTPTGVAMGRGLYNTASSTTSGQSTLLTDYSIGYAYDIWAGQFDPTKIRVDFKNLMRATSIPGKLYITGLKLVPNENAPETGTINLTITNGDAGITTGTFSIGERVQRGIKFTAPSVTTPLISGRYSATGNMNETNSHKAARVTFEETAVNAWWSGRTTELVLETDEKYPNAAKFRKVRFEAPEDKLEKTNITFNVAEESRRYFKTDLFPNNDPLNYSQNIRVTSDKIIINNIFVQDYKTAIFYIDSWLSVAADYEGDIKLSLTGTGVIQQDRSSAVIAKAVPAVTVTADVTESKIGYQEQKTKDITIKENGAGYLQAGKTVTIEVSDRIYNDVAFANVASSVVTDGDIAITTPKIAGGKISFEVTRASTKPSTITFTDVNVKINRSVPESTKGYDIYVGGSAVAANWDEDKIDRVGDKFTVMGVKSPNKYLTIAYPANDKLDLEAGLLTDRVEISTTGGSYYTKAGVKHETSPTGEAYTTSAYISSASNSTMVPFRMLAHAFGLKDDQIVWDEKNETVTILTASKVVQFQKNSDTMTINGVSLPMVSPEGLPVKAEIKDDRIYLPFRALGNAFGVPVEFDTATKTAIYNPNGFVNVPK